MSESPASNNSVATSSSWTAFLKSIASFNGDLSSLTAPPFIISATSLTEFSSYWCQHPELFVAPAREPDAAKRALLVLRWFLATLKQQYASRSEQYGNEKKPLNPFLGELFIGRWDDAPAAEGGSGSGSTDLVSEQVSHHPPATAYSITNRDSGVHLEGYNAQKASFSRTINVKQIGHAVLSVPVAGAAEPERYLITLPSLHIEGLLFGAPFVELDGSSQITSSSGFTARIDYSGKGWLSGKKNSVTATLFRTGDEKDIVYSVSGQWTGVMTFVKGKKGDVVDTLDAAAAKTVPLTVAPIPDQHPLESRRAWAKVAAAVARGDYDAIGVEKGKIEHAQREARAREKQDPAPRLWERRYFTAVDPATADPVLAALGSTVGIAADGDRDRTGGLWRFDFAKAERARAEPPLSPEDAAALEKELLGQ
jgi:hypothetical protein